ncbi:hypothetical protein KKI93_16980 [Xenorhabdus bovienii]|uniref:hypothetical protein n=1 Tax=Xenorhabdus bovienii TaxID=40576 RepID=UPI0023B2B6F1|nr:hypothetical protein [Xenorhabdus bovienii]MDE9565713.1 hypothetical protein [Xenorhabdus bovienii]
MSYDRFNPEWQQNILLAFYECKHGRVTEEEWELLCEPYNTYKDFYDNIMYLARSDLLDISECPRSNSADAHTLNMPIVLDPGWISITNKGIDFLRADGGLGAILNVNIVKFHDDTLETLSSYIDRLNVSDSEKSTLKTELKKLPVDGLRHIMTKAIDTALTNPGEILKVIYAAVGQG